MVIKHKDYVRLVTLYCIIKCPLKYEFFLTLNTYDWPLSNLILHFLFVICPFYMVHCIRNFLLIDVQMQIPPPHTHTNTLPEIKLLQIKKGHIHVFYAPEIEDRGAYCFCPVCHSVIPSFCHSVIFSETLTLLITFEQ